MDCPNCKRLLYSRQHKHCGFCGAELPPGVVFSAEEIAAVQAEQQAIACPLRPSPGERRGSSKRS